MKKAILFSSFALASLVASSAFAAGVLVPGSTYSIGTTQSTVFKTSPKVHILTDLTSGAAPATSWLANAYHEAGLGKTKGLVYGTGSDDPGTYYMTAPATAPTSTTALSGMTQEK